jgi:hypothetical protein
MYGGNLLLIQRLGNIKASAEQGPGQAAQSDLHIKLRSECLYIYHIVVLVGLPVDSYPT